MNLCVENLSYSFDGVHDLWKDVSLAVGKGDIFSIMGVPTERANPLCSIR